ncbi:MAG: hypothetical protein LRY36_02215 [Alphaproteobacteria bacterium]|nr:hypothetical protein [Alphaproteobacteria bacterium]
MAGLSGKQRHNIDVARTSTTNQFPDIQGTMDKLDSLVDVVFSKNPQLVERIQGEANRIGIIWTAAAPTNLDARSDAVYQGYRAPGYVRSLIDQLNDPKDPKIAQFWQEFSKSYDPAKHGDILKEASKILGQDLSKKLGVNAPAPAYHTNAPPRNAPAAAQPAQQQPTPAASGDAVLGQKATDILARAGHLNPNEIAAIQNANDKMVRLLDLSWKDENGNGINNQARDLIARMGVEANTNANNWLKRAPEGLHESVSYNQYSAPGYFVSLRDQLKDSPKFWNELKKAYDKDMADGTLSDRMRTTLQEAGEVLGQNLLQKLESAPRATMNNVPSPRRNPVRDRATDNTIDSHENVAPANFAETRVDPGNARQRDQLAVQALPVETLKKLGIGPTVESGLWDEPGVRKGAARISPLELTARDFNPDFLKDLQNQPGLIGVVAKALSQFFKHDDQAKSVDPQALERHLSQTLKDGTAPGRRAEADNPTYGIAEIANRAGPTDLSQKTFQTAAANIQPEVQPNPALDVTHKTAPPVMSA